MPKVVQQTTKKEKKSSSVLDRILPVSKLADKGIKLAIYGGSGTGKTRFACSATKDLLIIGAEEGTGSVRTDKGVYFFPLQDSSDLTELLQYCRTSGKYKTVVLDTGTMLQDLLLKEVLGLDDIPLQKSWGMASQKQYGQSALKCKVFLKEILDLTDVGIDAIIICQERNYNEAVDSDILTPTIGSSLSKSVAEWLHPACDFVVQTFKRNRTEIKKVKIAGKEVQTEVKTKDVEFCLRTGIHDSYITKFRLPRGTELPEVLVNPQWQDLVNLVKGG